MATWLKVFHASTRVASTGNLRGTPSFGSASRVVTRTAPLEADLRRKGSKNTVKPAARGTKPSTAPMRLAAIFFKKSRRPFGKGTFLASFIYKMRWDRIREEFG